MTKTLHSAISMASLALAMFSHNVGADKLCSIPTFSYGPARTEYPHLAFAIDALKEYPIAAWYTDRMPADDRVTLLQRITSECPEDSLMTIVVYGLPNKDCSGGFSSAGSVNDTATYKEFLKELTTAIGDRKVLYVVEPDAAALQVDDSGCGAKLGYLENLKVAIEVLSGNANAKLYLDVGYWTLMSETLFPKIMPVIEELNASKRLHGIVLNTSNYRSTAQIAELCTKFQHAIDSTTLKCIIDTSRNYVPPINTDWCNVLRAGIGAPPSSETNYPNLEYNLWIKVPGESDGTCNGGPDAGQFYETAFQNLWDQGYLVHELGMKSIGAGNNSTSPKNGSVVQVDDPTIQSETPIIPSVAPIAQSETPIALSATPTILVETPLANSATPLIHSGSSFTNGVGPAIQSATPLIQSGDSITNVVGPTIKSATSSIPSGNPTTQSVTPTIPSATSLIPSGSPITQSATPLI